MTRKWIDFNARKTWAVLLAVLVLVFAVGGYGSYRVSEQRIRAEKHNELAVIAALKSGQIAEWRQARLDDARMYAASPLFRRAVAAWLKVADVTALVAALKTALAAEVGECAPPSDWWRARWCWPPAVPGRTCRCSGCCAGRGGKALPLFLFSTYFIVVVCHIND